MMKAGTLFLKKIISKLPVLSFDAMAIPVAWYLAFWLRYNMHVYPIQLETPYSLSALAIIAVLQIACYYHFKVYRGLWRFSSLNDVARILKAVVCATLLVIPVLYMMSLLQYIPRAILPAYSLFLIALLCGGRLLFRHSWDKKINIVTRVRRSVY